MLNNELKTQILDELKSMEGHVGFCYKNLITGEAFGYHENDQFLPASIVKLPLLAAMLLLESQGKISFDETVTITPEQKVPGCGVVQHMPGDVTLDVRTLAKFMMTISDTTATNGLFRHYGDEVIGDAFHQLGLSGTQFNRAYWDEEKENRGINNYYVPAEISMLLEKMFHRTLISEDASLRLENILLQQQINHKMGGHLPEDFPIAHKTGEEEDKTHDVGIVYTKEPFIVCFASHLTPIPYFEDFIRRTTLALVKDITPDLETWDFSKSGKN